METWKSWCDITLYIKVTENKSTTSNNCQSLVPGEKKLKVLSSYQSNGLINLIFRPEFHIA